MSDKKTENDFSVTPNRLIFILVFGIAMAYFEAALVVYLRELFYPEGFSFPLKAFPQRLIIIELFRELSTIIMLAAVAAIAARRFWERFACFIILFGVWDIFYYIWLKATIGWPASLLEWDILFLIPLPWIGPVIAPVSIAVLMVWGGLAIIGLYRKGHDFRVYPVTWICWIAATLVILYSFMKDTDATLRFQMPQPYNYGLLLSGLFLYIVGYMVSHRKVRKRGIS